MKSEDSAGQEASAGELRREKILAASWKALAEVGFEKITTRRIAETAGINIATLHYHFGSKEALLVETLRHAQRWSVRRMQEALIGAKTPAEMLLREFDLLWDLVRLRPGVLRFDMVVRGFRDEEARREAEVVYTSYRAVVLEIIEQHIGAGGTLEEGLTPESLAHYVISTIDGIILHHTLSGDDAAAKRNLGLVRQHVFQLMGLPAVPASEKIDRL